MYSRIYEGQVRHRRFSPKPHSFDYKLYMMYLDLDELPTLFDNYWLWSVDRRNLAWFDRREHLGEPETSLIDCVRNRICQQTGIVADGPIRLLTHCRYFGFGFNPVSFYYCYEVDGETLQAIVAEVNNTPWGEQYCYVLTESQNVSETDTHRRYRPSKAFHVSPFIPMDIDYDWRFGLPGERLSVHMENYIEGDKLFDATLDLHEHEINSANLARVLTRYPLVTMKVVAGIYFEAMRLLIKRVPFFDHPSLTATKVETRES